MVADVDLGLGDFGTVDVGGDLTGGVGVEVGDDDLVYGLAAGEILDGDAAHHAGTAQYDDFHG